MAEQHRKRRRAHLDQHIRDASGEYHYIGAWYVLSGGRKALLPFAGWAVLAAGAFIAAGCVDFPGMRNTWYVIIPYVLTAAMVFALFWQGGRLVSGLGRLKAFDYERVKDNLAPITGGLIAFSLLTALLGGVYLIKHGVDAPGQTALFFAMLLLAALCAWMAGKAYRKQEWSVEE